MDARYDCVVIGSGFGGSITACRLAQAGQSVCVLERGRRWPRTAFPRTPAQVSSEAFWDMDARRFGLIEYSVFERIHVIHGSGVGGGSLHYFNVHIRPPPSIFGLFRVFRGWYCASQAQLRDAPSPLGPR